MTALIKSKPKGMWPEPRDPFFNLAIIYIFATDEDMHFGFVRQGRFGQILVTRSVAVTEKFLESCRF